MLLRKPLLFRNLLFRHLSGTFLRLTDQRLFPILKRKKISPAYTNLERLSKPSGVSIRNLNLVIDAPVIISGYLAPYFTEEDIDYLLNYINSSTPFALEKEQIFVGVHGQYTPAIGVSLYYVEQFLQSI